MGWGYALCCCAALVSALAWFFLLQGSGIDEYEFSSVRSVDVLHLKSPSTPFSQQTISSDEPLVIRNSVTSLWRARKLWSPSYLQRKIGSLSGIYSNDNRWFGPYYDTSKPLTSMSHRLNQYSTDTTMAAWKFFQRIQHPEQGRYLYYSAEIGRLGDWASEDVQPLNELLTPNPQRSSVNVWIGQPHVIAHCHYDGYYNFYAQLYGTKQFTMFRPTNWPGLYPYPFLHPSHAQAQVNLSDSLNVGSFPLTKKVEAYRVVLQPGDLLFMPPMWFHHVESMDVSISVNVWTDSDQTAIMEDVFALQLPTTIFHWSDSRVEAVAGSVLVNRAVTEVCKLRKCPHPDNDYFASPNLPTGLDSSDYLVHKLWTTRFQRLMEKGEQSNYFTDDERTSHRKALLCENDTSLSHSHKLEIAEWLKKVNMDNYLNRLRELVAKLPSDTWEIWFGNYLEYITANVVSLQHVGLFLRHSNSCIKYM